MKSIQPETSGGKDIQANKRGLTSTYELVERNAHAEYMYLRENDITVFEASRVLPNLKVLDLSLNFIAGPCDWLALMPNLKHLYLTGNEITTLDGISELGELETLAISNNCIASFEGLHSLPKLRVLSLSMNEIQSFEGFPLLPSLFAISLAGNPVAEMADYRKLTIAVCNRETLCKIDGKDVDEQDLEGVANLQGKVAFCVMEGFVPDTDGCIEDQCARFLLLRQQEQATNQSLWPHGISINPMGDKYAEGELVTLHICLQDMREIETRKRNVFFSPYLFPVAFKVSGEATEVFVVGSMNGWTDPIPLDRCEEDGEVSFQATLYLPEGDYEYRYLVDGVEKVSEHNKITSKHAEGMCNVYNVQPNTAVQHDEEHQETILHIRWHRSIESNRFDLIDDENGIQYLLTAEDVGGCLQAEVLVYLDGEFHSMFCDISVPVEAGLPKVTGLSIQGPPSEGALLTMSGMYSGGAEGPSQVTWSRVLPDGEEILIEVENPFHGYNPTLEDVGCKVKVTYVPIREDWVTGRPAMAFTETIGAEPPMCKRLDVVGTFVEHEPLRIEAEYGGGFEGQPRYQWLRETASSSIDAPEFDAIPGATDSTYLPCRDDVDRRLAVDCAPIHKGGLVGETHRVITDRVAPGLPMIASLEIVGEPEESKTLEVVAQYFGGAPGQHGIQWLRNVECEDGTRASVCVGLANSLQYVPQQSDVGCVLEVSCTPVRADGLSGTPVQVRTNCAVAPGPPRVDNLALDGAWELHGSVSLRADYSGGHEGASRIEWCAAPAGAGPDAYVPLGIAPDARSHVVRRGDCGKCLRVVYTPVRADGVAGAPATVVSPAIAAAPPEPEALVTADAGLTVGSVVQGSWRNVGPAPDAERWIRVGPDGSETVIATESRSDAEGPQAFEHYAVTDEDVGCRLVYAINVGQWVYSDATATVAPAASSAADAPDPEAGEAAVKEPALVSGPPSPNASQEVAEPDAAPEQATPSAGAGVEAGAAAESPPVAEAAVGAAAPEQAEPSPGAGAVAEAPPAAEAAEEPSPDVLLRVQLPATAIEGVPLMPTLVGVEVDHCRLEVGWCRSSLTEAQDVVVSRDLVYVPTAADVGCMLLCTVLPDGTPASSLKGYVGPVEAAGLPASPAAPPGPRPRGVECRLAGPAVCGGVLTASVAYACSPYVPEGVSEWRWFTVDAAGVEQLVPAARGNRLLVTPEDVGWRIKFRYTPVTCKGVPGLPVAAVSEVVAAQAFQIPERSYCMRLQTVRLPEGMDPQSPGLRCTWECAATLLTGWQATGPWVGVCRGLACQPTADEVGHVLRVTVEDGGCSRTSNASAVLLNDTIHDALLDRIAPGQSAINVQVCAGRRTPPPRDALERGGGSPPPPPPSSSRAPGLCPATVPLMPSASLDGICN